MLGATLGIDIEAEIINLDIHKGAGYSHVLNSVPDLEELDDEHAPTINRAIIYATALQVLPWWKVQRTKVDQTPSAKTEVFDIDWDKLESDLQEKLGFALQELNPDILEEAMGLGGIGFTLTKPCIKPRRNRRCY